MEMKGSITAAQKSFLAGMMQKHPDYFATELKKRAKSIDELSKQEAHDLLSEAQKYYEEKTGYRIGSLRAICAENLLQNDLRDWTSFNDLKDYVKHTAKNPEDIRLDFKRNVNGKRVSLGTAAEQLEALRNTLASTASELRAKGKEKLPPYQKTQYVGKDINGVELYVGDRVAVFGTYEKTLLEDSDQFYGEIGVIVGAKTSFDIYALVLLDNFPEAGADRFMVDGVERNVWVVAPNLVELFNAKDKFERKEKAAPKKNTAMQPKEFLEKQWEMRRYMEKKNASGDYADHISMRGIINGARRYKAGIPFEASLDAQTTHWNEESRKAMGITTFNWSKVKQLKVEEFKPITEPPHVNGTMHKQTPHILRNIAAGVPTLLHGPAGTGKSTIPHQVADLLGKPFGMIPMTAGATPSWLTGAYTLNGWVTRPFVQIYSKGGVFLFDEMDAADANMLLLVNGALAQSYFYNPADGKVYHKHQDFVPMAAMNTLGLGANRHYTGRERLDAATLDRWAVGRFYIGPDEKLEEKIFWQIINADEKTEEVEKPKVTITKVERTNRPARKPKAKA